jgi:HEPN domain-containing protein
VAASTDPAAWVAKADHDLLNIANNLTAAQLTGTPVPWDTVCFHAQQAGEKLLKAYLIARSETPPHTHDMVRLLATCLSHDQSLTDIESDCIALAAYGVFPRYPDDVDDLDETDARPLIDVAQRIRARIVPLL